MRDALSILDKIVSFTNGEVNYQHTLEHLNILDADYYFKLIDSMLQQDLAGAMLLFDDINRKGFEEELVLNGFSEFIRNLLISKDERIAGLLDVVESFKEKYIATAKKVSTGYLVSALNILNETEINYKGARNKRLHVELALIRLTYLLQALEITTGAEGLSKKKIVESAKPVAFKKIAPIKIAENDSFSAKIIDKEVHPRSRGGQTSSETPDSARPLPPAGDKSPITKESPKTIEFSGTQESPKTTGFSGTQESPKTTGFSGTQGFPKTTGLSDTQESPKTTEFSKTQESPKTTEFSKTQETSKTTEFSEIQETSNAVAYPPLAGGGFASRNRRWTTTSA